MALKIQIGRDAELRKANSALSRGLGSAIALLNEILHVESWEEFEEKRDRILPVLEPRFKELLSESRD